MTTTTTRMMTTVWATKHEMWVEIKGGLTEGLSRRVAARS
jgi:hypothetical protein